MKRLDFLKRFLEHRYLPAVLAIGAILVMLPALKTGLIGDDLVQRVVELKPSQLPARMHEMGMPPDSGSFSTVLRDLFGFSRDPRWMTLAQKRQFSANVRRVLDEAPPLRDGRWLWIRPRSAADLDSIKALLDIKRGTTRGKRGKP